MNIVRNYDIEKLPRIPTKDGELQKLTFADIRNLYTLYGLAMANLKAELVEEMTNLKILKLKQSTTSKKEKVDFTNTICEQLVVVSGLESKIEYTKYVYDILSREYTYRYRKMYTDVKPIGTSSAEVKDFEEDVIEGLNNGTNIKPNGTRHRISI